MTAGGIASGMEMGFHLLKRADYDDAFVAEVARIMKTRSLGNSTGRIRSTEA